MADRVEDRLTALEDEVNLLKARFAAGERDRQSETVELQSDIARLGADLASGLSNVKKDIATGIKRLGAIETRLGAIEEQPDEWPDKIGQLVREVVQELKP